jgi:hypothetical protein
MEVSSAKIYDQATSVATHYAPSTAGANVGRMSDVSITIVHPASTSTTYSIQGSDMSDDDVRAGKDDWVDYDLAEAIPQKVAAETFGIVLEDFEFKRLRLKMVTAAGTGVITARMHTKGG